MPVVSIAPMALVHPFLASHLLSSYNTWNIIYMRAVLLVHGPISQSFVDCMWSCTITPTRAMNNLTNVDLDGSTLKQRRYIMEHIVPSHTPPPIPEYHHLVHYLFTPQATHPPDLSRQPLGTSDL